NHSPYVKDAINDAVVQNNIDLVNPNRCGTKAAAHYQFQIPAGESVSIRLRLANIQPDSSSDGGSNEIALWERQFDDFDKIFAARQAEADEFYRDVAPISLGDDHRQIQRQ